MCTLTVCKSGRSHRRYTSPNIVKRALWSRVHRCLLLCGVNYPGGFVRKWSCPLLCLIIIHQNRKTSSTQQLSLNFFKVFRGDIYNFITSFLKLLQDGGFHQFHFRDGKFKTRRAIVLALLVVCGSFKRQCASCWGSSRPLTRIVQSGLNRL